MECSICHKTIDFKLVIRKERTSMEVCMDCYQPVVTLPDTPDKKHTEDCGIDGLVLHHQCPEGCMQIMTPEEVGSNA